MDLIIYDLSIQMDNPVELDVLTDTNPNPKLIKFGHNSIGGKLDMMFIVSNTHYKDGLQYDFTNTTPDSITTIGNKTFGITTFDQTFAEMWEIFTLFNLFEKNKTVYSPEHTSTLQQLVDCYKVFNSKTKIEIKNNNPSTIFYKYSEIDLDENTALRFIMKNVPELMKNQEVGSALIVQIFDIQTSVSLQILYLLSIMYQEAYIMKPTIVPDISASKYLILINKKNKNILKFPTIDDNLYISSFGTFPIPEQYENIVQCFNSEILPKRYKQYIKIKNYLESKVYDGAIYQDLLNEQNKNSVKWIDTFGKTENLSELLTSALKKSSDNCHSYSNLVDIFN